MKTRYWLSILLTHAATNLAFAQGPLNPPGPPAPTMKSLEEVATRLEQAHAKLDQSDAKSERRTPISSLPFTIEAPGSYYLTGNLTGVAGQNGINVNASDVTIDLNGFRLSGPGNNGIFSASSENIAVRNGSVTGWGVRGITLGGAGALVEHVRASDNTSVGISAGEHSIVQSCTVTGSGTGAQGRGISVGNGGIVSKCVVSGAAGSSAAGINAANGAYIVDCVARDNNAAGGYGIVVTSNAAVIRCDASLNTGTVAGISVGSEGRIVDCVASGNDGAGNAGIIAGQRCLVSGCNAAGNGGVGIQISNTTLLLNNNTTGNGSDGVKVLGGSNRVEGNNSANNTGTGFTVMGLSSIDNLIIRNSAANNSGVEYNIGSGNLVAPTVTQANINTAAGTHPHANFEFD